MNYESEQYEGELRQLREKVKVYETMLHNLQLYSMVTMDEPPIRHMINIICNWSYAHRAGNGELSEEEIQENINHWFNQMKEGYWRPSVRNSGVETQFKKK